MALFNESFQTGPKFEFKDITIKKANSINNFGDYFFIFKISLLTGYLNSLILKDYIMIKNKKIYKLEKEGVKNGEDLY